MLSHISAGCTRRRVIIAVVGLVLLALACRLAFVGLVRALPDVELSSANTPEEMFQAVLAQPIPVDVADVQGGGYTWQGYSIWLRFSAGPATVARLAGAYAPAACALVVPELGVQDKALVFMPAWQPKASAGTQCYTAQGVANTWTHMGTHYLLYDAAGGVVYFHGIGS